MGQSLASRLRTKDSAWHPRPTGGGQWGRLLRDQGWPGASAGELGGRENGRASPGRSGARQALDGPAAVAARVRGGERVSGSGPRPDPSTR